MNKILKILKVLHSYMNDFFKNQNRKIIILLSAGICVNLNTSAQSLPHPIIWASEADKARILDNISEYSWAATLKNDLKSRVDSKKNSHKSNPAMLLNSIGAIPGPRNGHCNMLDIAVESGILYYLYGDSDYAQLSADIVNYYAEKLGVPDYKNCDPLTGEDFFTESRTFYTRFGIAYDFIFSFVKDPATTVFDKTTGTRKPFNHDKAQQTCKNLANLVLKNGGLNTNHSILEDPGALYNIICIDDSTTREEFFNRFWNGDTRNDAFNGYSLKTCRDNGGLWPESMSYGKGPHNGLIRMMEIIDRFKPELDIFANNMIILENAFIYENFKYPNNLEIAAYGDSRRNSIKLDEIYRNVLEIATRKKFTDLAARATQILQQTFRTTGYKPRITNEYLDWNVPLDLLWGINFDLSGTIAPIKYSTTATIEHAGVVMQRNYFTSDAKNNGLMYYTGGNHYVHSHLSGLDMELYGAGYVMAGVAADMPSPNDRALDINRHYYRIYAGHNTVIVNGTSQGRGSGSWKSDGILWQNKTELLASEPKNLEEPISEDFCFTTQFLDDNVNNCDQERTNAIVRTSPTTAYYLDIFRSKSNGTNNFHDYVYHNIGDALTLTDSVNNTLALSAAPTRYQSFDVSYNGAVVKFPGWHYFESVNVSAATTKQIKSTIKLNTTPNRFMYVAMPGGNMREYAKALAPPILEVAAGYDKKKAQVLTIRQTGEAWNRPFVAAFEPSTNSRPTVQFIENIYNGDAIIGAKVISEIGDKTIEDYILCLPGSNSSVTLQNGISFTGRFAVVRYEQDLDTALTTLYIGEGDSLVYGDFSLITEAGRKGIKVEGGEPYFGRQILFKNIKNKDVVPKGSNLSIEAIVSKEFTEVTLWGNDTINLGTKTEAPYVWSGHPLISNMQDDEYTFTLIAKSAQGIIGKKTIVIETPGQKPYPDSEVPHSVPGKIEFEDYDSGGENFGYFDKSVQDPSLYSYRDTDYVDLGRNGTVVSSLGAGEWLEYTVDVKQTGLYKLSIRHRTTLSPGVEAFSVLLPNEGDTLLSNCQTLYTGRSEFYDDLIGEIFLKEGKRVLRFSILGSDFDLDYMELELTKATNTNEVTQESKQIKVFPNPSNGHFTIQLGNNDFARYSLYNINGVKVLEGTFKSGTTINTANIMQGIYLLELSGNNDREVHKVIIR